MNLPYPRIERSTGPEWVRGARRAGAAASAAIVLALALMACGGASYTGAVPPTTVGDAERDVDAAEATLGSALGLPPLQGAAEPQLNQPGQSQPGQNAGPPPGQMPPPAESPRTDSTADEHPAPQEENRCQTACDALSSMLRAVDRLCSLTGQGEERCQSARTRANRASERVAQACPACSPA